MHSLTLKMYVHKHFTATKLQKSGCQRADSKRMKGKKVAAAAAAASKKMTGSII